jgi:hypothetical protein
MYKDSPYDFLIMSKDILKFERRIELIISI